MDEHEIRDLEKKILSVEQLVLIKVSALEASIANMHETMKSLVTRERFEPVAWVAYGLAAGVLTTALGAVMTKVFVQ